MSADFYASHPHLVDYLAPLWHALDESERGTFYVMGHKWVPEHARSLGIDPKCDSPQWPGGVTVVASAADYGHTHSSRPVVYLEHGAGQTYSDHAWHPAYSGGSHRDRVVCFLTLNETTAARERATYRDARIEMVGSLRLDALSSAVARTHTPPVMHAPRRPLAPARAALVVACAWHWRCQLVPETYTAWEHWRHTFADLAAQGVTVLGHGHPRIYRELAGWYEAHGIEPVQDFVEVVERADVLCFDNTSAGYEAAALGLPVVALNSPAWRRDVHHGLRFWDQVPGPQADRPDDLWPALEEAFSDEWAERRAEITAQVYPPETRGQSVRLAVDALRVTLARTASV